MSSDSQTGKESRTQRSPDNPRSGRSEGDKAAHNDQEEVIQIPENKVGIVIGKKGWRRNDIKERSGVQALVIKDCQARITGTEEQRTKAKTLIYRILSVRHSKCPFYHSFIFISTCLPACGILACLFVCLDNLVLPTGLIMWIGHRNEIRKLTLRA